MQLDELDRVAAVQSEAEALSEAQLLGVAVNAPKELPGIRRAFYQRLEVTALSTAQRDRDRARTAAMFERIQLADRIARRQRRARRAARAAPATETET